MRLQFDESRVGLYLNTLRSLRIVQIFGRVKRLLPKWPGKPPCQTQIRLVCEQFVEPVNRYASLVDTDTFHFMNEENRVLGREGWNSPNISRLWLYNLHYFDFLGAPDWSDRTVVHIALVERWIDENPPAVGVGWEPYPTSLRIVNWIKREFRSPWMSDPIKASLFHQAGWLCRNLEYHLLGNHLWSNAKAMLFAGAFFEGENAENWQHIALSVLSDQLCEQVLECGGHFERSPMYHALFLEDLLDISNLVRTYRLNIDQEFRISLASAILRMGRWFGIMCHPDGDLSFFNDSAFNIAAKQEALFEYAERSGVFFDTSMQASLVDFDASGYVVAKLGCAKVLMDLAPVGPDYMPGHGHADTLSFEMSLGSQRIFVNSGTSTYESSSERLRQRGTAAHNTAVIDQKDSSQVWSSFRVAKRATVMDKKVEFSNGHVTVCAAHNGYVRLRQSAVHMRSWELTDSRLRIVDRFSGSGTHEIQIFFHLHPLIYGARMDDGHFVLRSVESEGYQLIVQVDGADLTQLISDSWHPQFGVTEVTNALQWAAVRELPLEVVTDIAWSAEKVKAIQM